MVGLVDIAPSTRTVRVGGDDVSVFGVSAKGIASLLVSFPDLQKVFVGDGVVDMTTIAGVAPDAIAAIIAAGCGSPGDPKAIEIAATLPAQYQANLFGAILELTLPDGIGPFVEALTGAMEKLSLENRGKAPVLKSPSPSKT